VIYLFGKAGKLLGMKLFFWFFASILVVAPCTFTNDNTFKIQKGSLLYDFSFAELAIKYLETGDSTYLLEIASLEATEHLLNHASQFNYNVPKESAYELSVYLLSDFLDDEKVIELIRRNLQFAKDSIALTDFPQKICLQYLPENFVFRGKLFFTVGYDLGVVYANNASLNIVHPRFITIIDEMKYYAIHELHHAGFLQLKESQMPSLDITTYGEMAELIEYFTHLEGMGTYVPLDSRTKSDALASDPDYIALMDIEKMEKFEKEYFEIYFHFKNHPDKLLNPEDWQKIASLSDGKRLWYRVGANIAKKIDEKKGREKLIEILNEPTENFIRTYLNLKNETERNTDN